MRKEKKGERKEDLNPAVRRQALTPGVNTEEGDSLSSVLTKAPIKLLHKPPSSSQPVSPTIHLNISLNSAPNLPLFNTHQPIIKLSCQRKKTHPTPNLQGALTTGTEQTVWLHKKNVSPKPR
uniref:Uncharacterized protein n=1 Tax=Knipowitschia caucasica TaxID=637954 RepID=A0AAV2J9R6_KNICA